MRRSKYGSRKTEIEGIVFDSAAEASRYGQLRMMQNAGMITGLRRQVSYEIIPSEKGPDGRSLRPLRYVADFVYIDCRGIEHVEDVKGVLTKEYRIKKRLMWHILGIAIEEYR